MLNGLIFDLVELPAGGTFVLKLCDVENCSAVYFLVVNNMTLFQKYNDMKFSEETIIF